LFEEWVAANSSADHDAHAVASCTEVFPPIVNPFRSMKHVLVLFYLTGLLGHAADSPATKPPAPTPAPATATAAPKATDAKTPVTAATAADSPTTAKAAVNATRHYVQLIQGSDQPQAPFPGARAVGPKIRKQLEPMFRWKNYWETQRAEVLVESGKSARVELKDGRAVVIDLQQAGKRAIHLYRGKKLVRTAVCARDKEVCIQGSDSSDGAAWFVVVRTDPPAT
jgi:hypothetical protein